MDTPSRHVAIAATRFKNSSKNTPIELINKLNALFDLPPTQPEPEVTWVINPVEAVKNQLGNVVIPPFCEREKLTVAVTGSKRNGVKKVPVYYKKSREDTQACQKAAEAHLAKEAVVHNPVLHLKHEQNVSF